jgi:hypothetical protein
LLVKAGIIIDRRESDTRLAHINQSKMQPCMTTTMTKMRITVAKALLSSVSAVDPEARSASGLEVLVVVVASSGATAACSTRCVGGDDVSMSDSSELH